MLKTQSKNNEKSNISFKTNNIIKYKLNCSKYFIVSVNCFNPSKQVNSFVIDFYTICFFVTANVLI